MTGWNTHPEHDCRRARPQLACADCGARFTPRNGGKVRCGPCGSEHAERLKRQRDAARYAARKARA